MMRSLLLIQNRQQEQKNGFSVFKRMVHGLMCHHLNTENKERMNLTDVFF